MIALGLDYGTTNSLVAVYQREMSNKQVRRVHKASNATVGGQYIRSPKRLLNSICRTNQQAIISCIDSCVNQLLNDLKAKLSDKEREKVRLALTVPNAFKDNQCDLLRNTVLHTFSNHFDRFDSDCVDIIPEPVAAALYYAYCLKMKEGAIDGRRYIIVSDMGGGTTDLAVVRIEMRGNNLYFKVIATEHDSALGGDDVDALVAEHLQSRYGLTDIEDKYLHMASQNLKKKLSVAQSKGLADSAESLLLLESGSYVKDGAELNLQLDTDIMYNLMNKPTSKHQDGFIRTYTNLVAKLSYEFQRLLVDKEGYDEVDSVFRHKVILLPVGGSSHLKAVRDAFFNQFPQSSCFKLNTEVGDCDTGEANYDSVVRGAAIYSAYLSGMLTEMCSKIVIENRTMHNISVRYSSERMYTCVKKTMPDDTYLAEFNPKLLSADGKTFTIGNLEFYQGGNESVSDRDCVKLGEVSIDDIIYTGGKAREDVKIILKTKIVSGRIQEMSLSVPGGRNDGSDFTITNLKIKSNEA